MDPGDFLGIAIMLAVLLFFGSLMRKFDPTKPGEGQPCFLNGKPHKWEYLQVKNQFGEDVWVHRCTVCKRRPGEFS